MKVLRTSTGCRSAGRALRFRIISALPADQPIRAAEHGLQIATSVQNWLDLALLVFSILT